MHAPNRMDNLSGSSYNNVYSKRTPKKEKKEEKEKGKKPTACDPIVELSKYVFFYTLTHKHDLLIPI